MTTAVYGELPAECLPAGGAALQLSPTVVGAPPVEDLRRESLDCIGIAAPPNTRERRYVLAQAVRALRPGGCMTVVARKDRGGLRLKRELQSFGFEVEERARRGERICRCLKPDQIDEAAIDSAIRLGGPQRPTALALWSQPGLFSWDRLDPGSRLLLDHLGDLAGAGADFGCGVGALALGILRSAAVATLCCIDIDLRATRLARLNIEDPRARILQQDLRSRAQPAADELLDFVVTNPPFHWRGDSDVALGGAFILAARRSLRRKGRVLLVANVALPYERILKAHFDESSEVSRAGGFKVLQGIA